MTAACAHCPATETTTTIVMLPGGGICAACVWLAAHALSADAAQRRGDEILARAYRTAGGTRLLRASDA